MSIESASDLDWRANAACKLEDAHIFNLPTPEETRFGDYGAARLAAASAICDRCPVYDQCRAAIVKDKGEGLAAGLLYANGRALRLQPHRGRADIDPQPCGTSAAYERHRRKGEPVDRACRDAIRAKNREQYRNRQARRADDRRQADLMPCGTRAAYLRHLRRREFVCDACAEAQRVYNRARRAGKNRKAAA